MISRPIGARGKHERGRILSMGAMRILGRSVLLFVAATLLVASAHATPLGLQFGDVIDTIEWDALDANGEARLQFRLAGKQPLPGRLTANFKTRVFERGGVQREIWLDGAAEARLTSTVPIPERMDQLDYLVAGVFW